MIYIFVNTRTRTSGSNVAVSLVFSNKTGLSVVSHNDVIKWRHLPRYWPFVRRIHRSSLNFPHKGQWRGASMFSLIRPWINSWVKNHTTGDFEAPLHPLWHQCNGLNFLPRYTEAWATCLGKYSISRKIYSLICSALFFFVAFWSCLLIIIIYLPILFRFASASRAALY